MGCHGSPTCEINFENAEGYLIGTPGRGLNHMFTFINTSRLGAYYAPSAIFRCTRTHAHALAHGHSHTVLPRARHPSPVTLTRSVTRYLCLASQKLPDYCNMAQPAVYPQPVNSLPPNLNWIVLTHP